MNCEDVNTSVFIASHLAEHVKHTSKIVIAASGIITILGRALRFGDRIDRLPVSRTPGRVDLIT